MLRAFLLLGCACSLVAATRAAERPNILFVIADDQSYPHAGAYGTAWIKTPAFDRVAREGLLFTRAYTPNAKCAPARACILTGRNSWQLEEAANHINNFPAKFRGCMEALGQHGYTTGFTGKGWGPGNAGTVDGKPRLLTGRGFHAIKTRPPTPTIAPVDYAANFEAFLAQRPRDRPFCFWLGTNEPHRRYQPGSGAKLGHKSPREIDRVPAYWPDTDTVRNDLLDYAFEIEYYDSHLARALAALEESGQLERTLIVVTADNGMPFPRAKSAAYELSNHVPLAIRWGAGIARPGRTVSDYVSFIDFAPTFLEAAGVTESASGMAAITGRSLGPIFRDAQPVAGRVQPGRESLLVGQERHDIGRPGDVGYPIRGIYRDDVLYLRNFEPARWPMGDPITGYLHIDGSPTKTMILAQNRQGVNHWQWELNFGRHPGEELYDLRADRDCLTNLASDPAWTARREALQRQLFAELERQQDPRLAGQGAMFDRYPHLNQPRYYERFMQGDRQPTPWADSTDFEAPDFDPEKPLQPAAVSSEAKRSRQL